MFNERLKTVLYCIATRVLSSYWEHHCASHVQYKAECVVPENSHWWKFHVGGELQKPKLLKESMKLNHNFHRCEERVSSWKTFCGRGMIILWNNIFSSETYPLVGQN